MGNSNRHQDYDVPHFFIGGKESGAASDRHLAYEHKTITTGNLLVSVLELYGQQGDSTGLLPNCCN